MKYGAGPGCLWALTTTSATLSSQSCFNEEAADRGGKQEETSSRKEFGICGSCFLLVWYPVRKDFACCWLARCREIDHDSACLDASTMMKCVAKATPQ